MPQQQQQQNVKKTKKRKPRKEQQPKYVFKVVKPSATPYKQSQQESRSKLSSEDAIRNLLKQQHQQNALQQQQLFSGFISQLGTLARQQPVTSGFSTSDGKQLLYPIAQAEVVKPYQSEVRASEAFVVPHLEKQHMMEKEEIEPPSWYATKEKRIPRDIDPMLEPWNAPSPEVSPFEQPPVEKVITPSPPREKERPPRENISALEKRRNELVARGAPWTTNEAKIVFGFDLRTKEGKATLKQLIDNELVK